MVLGVATGLLGLGLALPTGLAFGYGYGYGVRQGYSAFKQPSKTAQGLKMSPDPIQGSLGMGLQTAEERTGVKTPVPLSKGPSIQQNGNSMMPRSTLSNPLEVKRASHAMHDWVYSKSGRKRISRKQKKQMSRTVYKKWYNDTKDRIR